VQVRETAEKWKTSKPHITEEERQDLLEKVSTCPHCSCILHILLVIHYYYYFFPHTNNMSHSNTKEILLLLLLVVYVIWKYDYKTSLHLQSMYISCR
jgi:Ca2+/Na+ antiporter